MFDHQYFFGDKGRLALISLRSLLGIASFLLRLPLAAAQEPPPATSPPAGASAPEEVTLEEIVVTDDAMEQGPNLQTIDRQELEAQQVHTAVEALEREPAVSASTGRRGERIFTLRGFEQRQIVVLLDGAPAYVPYDGQVDLSLLSAEMIDHLTVIKGPASVLYGPNGLGGAVNIVTRRPGAGPLLGAIAEAGRGNSLLLGGIHSLQVGRLGYTLYSGMKRRDSLPLPTTFAAVQRENGVLRENSDSLLYQLGGNLELRWPPRHLFAVHLSYVDGSRGIPPGLLEPVVRYWRMTTWRGISSSLGHQATYLDGKLKVDELAYLRRYDNLLDSYDDATYHTQTSSRAFHSWYHDLILGGRIRARYHLDHLPWGSLALRFWTSGQHDRHQEEADESTTTEPISRSLLTFTPEAEAFLGERWSIMLALQTDVEVPGTTPGGGSSTQAGLGPLCAVRFDPYPTWTLQMTIARRNRFPTLRDRFSSAAGTRIPNPGLGPENAWHLGLESRWQPRPWLQLQASIFDAEVSELIELVSLGGGEQQIQNISGARLLGADSAIKLSPWRWLRFHGGYQWLHARRQDMLAGSDHLPYRPAHQGFTELQLSPWPWVSWTAALRLLGPRSYQHPASGAWQDLDSYTLLDMSLTFKPARWATIWLRSTNLLDRLVESELGYPEAGREIWVGVRLRYDPDRPPERSDR